MKDTTDANEAPAAAIWRAVRALQAHADACGVKARAVEIDADILAEPPQDPLGFYRIRKGYEEKIKIQQGLITELVDGLAVAQRALELRSHLNRSREDHATLDPWTVETAESEALVKAGALIEKAAAVSA